MQKRMEQLVSILNKYAYEYYVLDNPTVSDATYDKLYDELVLLQNQLGIILDDSPTKRVGGQALKSFKQHTHLSRLYSLDKCNSFEQLRDWDLKVKKALNSNVEYTLDYKLDGLTICLTYDEGKLIFASTRGDGIVGEDVTAQVLTIKSVPLSIPQKGKLEIQGEGIMRLSEFNKYNQSAKEPLKNPRNGAAGAIRNLDPKVTACRPLDIIFYSVNYFNDKDIANSTIKTQVDMQNFLHQNYFKTNSIFVSDDINMIIEKIKNVNKDDLDFLIDGMVIKVNDLDKRQMLGFTDKFPRWAIAFKFEAEEVDTILKNVVWNVGRTGKLTPLADLAPVQIGGVTVKSATLNNYNDILRKKIMIGSRVFVRRSNDVIPEVLGVASNQQQGKNIKQIKKPINCPFCGHDVIDDGANIFCPNQNNCPPQIYGKIQHFASKDCMDIEGLSSKTVISLYNVLNVTKVVDLYSLKKEDLQKLPSFKDKKISNLLNAINNSKNADLPHFINALGIPNVGKKLANDLARIYKSIDALSMASVLELAAISDIGEITAKEISKFFSTNASLVSQLISLGVNPIYSSNVSNGYFSGKKVVLTGTLEGFTRQQAAKLVEKLGGEVLSSVSKTTDIVVAGQSAGSKLKKALQLNIKIMDENEFTLALNT